MHNCYEHAHYTAMNLNFNILLITFLSVFAIASYLINVTNLQ